MALNGLSGRRQRGSVSGVVRGPSLARRRKHRHVVGTLFGPVTWRRLYEPRGHRGRSMYLLELRLGIEAGLATPALAERVGSWATTTRNTRCWRLSSETTAFRGHAPPCARCWEVAYRDGAPSRRRPGQTGVERDRAGPCLDGALSADAVGWARRHLCAAARGRGAGGGHRHRLRARPQGQAGGDGTWGRCLNPVRGRLPISSGVCSRRF